MPSPKEKRYIRINETPSVWWDDNGVAVAAYRDTLTGKTVIRPCPVIIWGKKKHRRKLNRGE